MVFSIETDAVFNRDEESNRAIMAVKTINEMVMTALTTVTQQPLLLPLYKTMIEVVVDTLPRGRVFENMLEKCLPMFRYFGTTAEGAGTAATAGSSSAAAGKPGPGD